MSGQSLAASSQERVQRSGGASLLGRLLSPPCGSSLSSSYLCSSSAFPPPPHLLSFGVCPGHRRNHASFPEFSSSSGLSPASSPSHPSRESLGCSSRPGFDRRHPVCGKPRSRGVRGRSCSSMSFPSVNGCPPVSLPLSQYIFSPALPRASSPVSPFGLPVDSSQMKNRALSPSCFSRSALSLFSSCPSPCPRRSHVSSSASSSYHRGHCCCCYVGAASMCSPRCFPLRKSVVSSFSPCRSHACHSLDVASCTSSLPDEVSRGASTAVKAKADEASRAKKARVDSGVAGALSGIACATILQPLDVIKTQQQQQQAPGTRHNPPSVGQICKRIYTMWGWRGFWRGLWPCLLRVGPGVGIYFYSLDFLTGSWKFVAAAAKKANAVSRLEEPSLVPSDGHNGSAQGSDREAGSLPLSNAVQKAEEETKAPPWYNAVVSAVARGVAVLVFNPISVIKTRVESSWSSSASPPPLHSVVLSMWRQEGPLSIFRGAWPTILRDVPFSGIFLGLYTWSRTRAGLDKPREQVEYFAVKNFACGASAAAVASVVTHPFDVIRTRIQLYGMLQQQHEEALRSSRSVESKSGLSAQVSTNGRGRPCEPVSAFEAAGKRPPAYVTCKQGNPGQTGTTFRAVGGAERPTGQVKMFFSSWAALFSRCHAKKDVNVRLWGLHLRYPVASEHGKWVAGRCGEITQIHAQQRRGTAVVSLDTLKKLSGVRRQVQHRALSVVSNNCLRPANSAAGASASALSFLQVSLSQRSSCIFSRFFDARAPFSSVQSNTARAETCFSSLLSPNRGDAISRSQGVLGSSVAGGASSRFTERAVSGSGPKSKPCVTMTKMMIETVREEGLMVLWRGLGARLAKRSLMSAMTWTSFEELRVFFGGLRA